MPHSADLASVIAAVREAGVIAMRHYHGAVRSWDKRPGDPVSEADLAVNKLLHDRLLDARPSYGWLSEEDEDNDARLSQARVWIVDPIDGTRAFLKRRPEFAISVALVENEQPVVGCVFNPATDELFAASAGRGARLNGRTIRTSGRRGLGHAKLLASQRTFEHHRWLARAPNAEFHQIGSIAYRMALVASGRFDASVSLSEKNDWDIAAADLIVREAGGRCTSAKAELRYNRRHLRHPDVIAAAPGVYAALLELVQDR
jgi:myo-inositol-1(or 4)-monophosphatase